MSTEPGIRSFVLSGRGERRREAVVAMESEHSGKKAEGRVSRAQSVLNLDTAKKKATVVGSRERSEKSRRVGEEI